jgi:hypothetical protein
MPAVVISYSRIHKRQIVPLVKFLQEMRPKLKSAVFWDDDFTTGEDWRQQFQKALKKSPKLLVFWCSHANTSSGVKGEIRYAFSQGKKVVPILLDDTPMRPQLAAVQGIDFRDLNLHLEVSRGRVRASFATAMTLVLAVAVWSHPPSVLQPFSGAQSDNSATTPIASTTATKETLPPGSDRYALPQDDGLNYFRYRRLDGGSLTFLSAVGDFDGDGKADLVIFRPASGTWFINGPQGPEGSLRPGADALEPISGPIGVALSVLPFLVRVFSWGQWRRRWSALCAGGEVWGDDESGQGTVVAVNSDPVFGMLLTTRFGP